MAIGPLLVLGSATHFLSLRLHALVGARANCQPGPTSSRTANAVSVARAFRGVRAVQPSEAEAATFLDSFLGPMADADLEVGPWPSQRRADVSGAADALAVDKTMLSMDWFL